MTAPKVYPMVCESPAPEAIAPCTCLDTDEDWRYVACAFEFEQGDDVTAMAEALFANFDDTNNKINELDIVFDGDAQAVANFAMNENTLGRLEIGDLWVSGFCVQPGQGPQLFTDTAFMKSHDSLEIILVSPHCKYQYPQTYSFAPNFLANLPALTSLKLDYYNYLAQPFPAEGFASLETLELDYTLSDLNPADIPPMPNLKKLLVSPLKTMSYIPAGLLTAFPVLEELHACCGGIEIVDTGFFEGMSNSRVVGMAFNKINSIDLTGLSPYTQVQLQQNAITQLTEANFRPFVEGVINTADATGFIGLDGNPLECSCDLKWLVSDLQAAHVFQGAMCADGTALADLTPEDINAQCP